MKLNRNAIFFLCVGMLISSYAFAQETTVESDMEITKLNENSELKMYVIERNVEGIGGSSLADLQGVTKNSCSVLHEMGNEDIQWVQSYFTGDKIYCIYKAKNIDLIKQHAVTLGVPADEINEVRSVVRSDPQ